MSFFFSDPTYVIILPAIVLALYAQLRIQFVYGRYNRVPTVNELTGAEVAREILRRNGLWGVRIERVDGILSDHYDPRTRVLRLSRDIHDGISVAAVGVAAHETGHAIQHARSYAPLALRSVLVTVAMFGSWLAWPLVALGFLFPGTTVHTDGDPGGQCRRGFYHRVVAGGIRSELAGDAQSP